MTMDDENSVYVGGLPYDITEESLRRVFSVYGSVINVKIVNDRGVRGKCYGFVTYSNRRSADDAIGDMDGKSIGGRVVRVNEVTTRAGSSIPVRVRLQPQSGGWDRRSDGNYDRDRYSDRSRERDRSQERRRDQYTEKERSLDFERRKDHETVDRSGDKERVFEGGDGDMRADRSYEENGRETNGTSAIEGRSQETKREDSAVLDGGRDREHLSNSSGDHNFQLKEEMERLIKMREVLQDEVLVREERLGKQQVVCLDLQKKAKRLEDLLISEKKRTSQCRNELSELCKSYSRVRECTDNLKDCELELQSLVNSAAKEGVVGVDGLGNGYA